MKTDSIISLLAILSYAIFGAALVFGLFTYGFTQEFKIFGVIFIALSIFGYFQVKAVDDFKKENRK